MENPTDFTEYRWGSHCTCGGNDDHYTRKEETYRRLSTGQCVCVRVCLPVSNPQCVAEFQPSPGFIYYFNV